MHHPPRMARILSALAGVVFGLFGAEMTFGQLRPDEGRSDAVLYSIEVRNGAGDLLASPMLVGEEGRPVHLNLSTEAGRHTEPLAMSLDLDPSPDGDNLCVGYRLSLWPDAVGRVERRRRESEVVAGRRAREDARVRPHPAAAPPSLGVIRCTSHEMRLACGLLW